MVSKLSKDVYFEIDQLDQQLQRVKKRIEAGQNFQNENANISNVNGSGVLLGSALDQSFKTELREVKSSVEHLYQSI